MSRLSALFKVRKKLLDRGETPDTLGHLRLDRTVGEQRISDLLDHAGFKDRQRPRFDMRRPRRRRRGRLSRRQRRRF
jgi:hypothetical protein